VSGCHLGCCSLHHCTLQQPVNHPQNKQTPTTVLSARFQKLTAAKPPPQIQQKTVELPVTLEELYLGATKVVSHSRQSYTEGGEAAAEARRLVVEVEPGMADGTAFVFEK